MACQKKNTTIVTGSTCTVEQLENGALLKCDQSSAVILNGLDGNSELSGIIGISEVLNPCGELGADQEVLLKLTNGAVLGLFDGGPHRDRLSALVPNVIYTTNDGFSCDFSVDEEGNLN